MYYKGKWCTAGGKDPLFGHVDGFQIDPKLFPGVLLSGFLAFLSGKLDMNFDYLFRSSYMPV